MEHGSYGLSGPPVVRLVTMVPDTGTENVRRHSMEVMTASDTTMKRNTVTSRTVLVSILLFSPSLCMLLSYKYRTQQTHSSILLEQICLTSLYCQSVSIQENALYQPIRIPCCSTTTNSSQFSFAYEYPCTPLNLISRPTSSLLFSIF